MDQGEGEEAKKKIQNQIEKMQNLNENQEMESGRNVQEGIENGAAPSNTKKKLKCFEIGLCCFNWRTKKKNIEVDEEKYVEKIEDSEQKDVKLTLEILEPAQKALSNHSIVTKLFGKLPTKTLLIIRLVNKFWEEEATKIIMEKMKTELSFDYDDESETIVDKNMKKLTDLNKCIQESRQFPCSSFSFSRCDLTDADLCEFFNLQGKEIKNLEFRYPYLSKLIDVLKFREILLEKAPNIETLSVIAPNCLCNDSLLFPKKVVLPHLKNFKFTGNFPQISEIILASPNLKEVKIGSLSDAMLLIPIKKIHLLKGVNLNFVFSLEESFENIDLVERLANSKPKLEDLSIKANGVYSVGRDLDLKIRFEKALSEILDSSKETLSRLDLSLFCLENFLEALKGPALKSVKYLTLSHITPFDVNYPPNFISSLCPNIQSLTLFGMADHLFVLDPNTSTVPLTQLQTIEIALNDVTNYYWRDVLNSVTIEIALNHVMNYYWSDRLNSLTLLAPNLTRLKFDFVENFLELMSSPCNFPNLKKLQVSFNVGPDYPENTFPTLDMAFTGFSEEMVMKLDQDPDYFNEMKMKRENNGIPRVAQSILDCPGLRYLEIRFLGDYSDQFDPSVRFITVVSGEFGFKMLKNLQVEIFSTSNKILATLESIKPYAKLTLKPHY